MKEKLTPALVLILLLSMTFWGAPSANAVGSCSFGYWAIDFDDDANAICEQSLWTIKSDNDGFDRVVTGSMGADNSDISSDQYDFGLVVRCTSKKLEVFAASTYEIFYQTAYKSGGGVQVKFDTGKVINYKFSKSTDNTGVFLNNPKTFATALSKAKNKVAIKFTSNEGLIVLHFPVSDFLQSKKTFSSAGCKF